MSRPSWSLPWRSLLRPVRLSSLLRVLAVLITLIPLGAFLRWLDSSDASLTDDKLSRRSYRNHGVLVAVDQAIVQSLHQGDPRATKCLSIQYSTNLPSVSLIIVFFNEKLHILLRTICSVVLRTPSHLLREIILVDDGSRNDEIQEELNRYIAQYFPSNLIQLRRFPTNKGLIKARLEGATIAKAEVLVFLDSHCEVSTGWLEPLLERIKENRKVIACPTVDSLNEDTLAYEPIVGFRATGLFSWSMYFTWGRRHEDEVPDEDDWKPYRTATFPGGLFAVNREWFFEVGSYDEDMDGWGGENIEMSFRVWMCHGSIEFVPCSRVAHLSRANNVTSQAATNRNLVRVAHVWLDDYIRLFHLARPELKSMERSMDLPTRKQLRDRLKCHSFKWFLHNICPQKFVPDENVQAWGRVRNTHSNQCLSVENFDEHEAYPFVMRPCVTNTSINYILQMFSLDRRGSLRREEWCLDVAHTKSPIVIPITEVLSYHCDDRVAGSWIHRSADSQLVNTKSSLCLTATKKHNIGLSSCSQALTPSLQSWTFDFYS